MTVVVVTAVVVVVVVTAEGADGSWGYFYTGPNRFDQEVLLWAEPCLSEQHLQS